MSQFYVNTDDDVRRCKESILSRTPISITALTPDERDVRMYQGMVQSVMEQSSPSQPKRYLVTMIDN